MLDGSAQAVVCDLNSYERRLVHILVRESEGLASHSIGEGNRKDVVISRAEA